MLFKMSKTLSGPNCVKVHHFSKLSCFSCFLLSENLQLLLLERLDEAQRLAIIESNNTKWEILKHTMLNKLMQLRDPSICCGQLVAGHFVADKLLPVKMLQRQKVAATF
jgi:hypothetical protein